MKWGLVDFARRHVVIRIQYWRFLSHMKMRIQGGQHLHGHVHINGAKNAFLPLIAATVLVKGKIEFCAAPRLTDTEKLIEILIDMGARVDWKDEHVVTIDTTQLDPAKLDKKKMKRLRGSILLLGPTGGGEQGPGRVRPAVGSRPEGGGGGRVQGGDRRRGVGS
jgi:UDP-N-acetylglucosamine enolpyruvyl transferase